MGLESIGSSPMFPSLMLRLDHIHFINHLKMNVARRTFVFKTIVNTRVLEFIKLLYNLRLIRKYYKITSKVYRIYPNWVNYSPIIKNIKCYRPNNNPIKISYKALLVLQMNSGASYIVLHTPHGVLTHQDAIRRHVGGILLCTIE